MSTEYYLHRSGNLIERLSGFEPDILFIGISAGGWVFGLSLYSNCKINSIRDWYKLFNRDSNRIVDEYGNVITVDEMMSIITDRPVFKDELKRYSDLHKHQTITVGGGSWDYIQYS